MTANVARVTWAGWRNGTGLTPPARPKSKNQPALEGLGAVVVEPVRSPQPDGGDEGRAVGGEHADQAEEKRAVVPTSS
jgi:hypothetical protein